MKSCALCQEEVTPRMIREGRALSSGSETFHRDCHRNFRQGAPLAAPLPAPADGVPAGTSFGHVAVGQELAGFWRRVGAHVVDGIILNVLAFFGGALIGLGAGAAGVVEPTAVTVMGGVIGGVIPLVYCIWFWMKKGATPGKLAMGIRVVQWNDEPLTGMQSFIRYIGYIPSGLVFGLGYLWMLFDSENRCWHDMMAGTRVVRV